MARDKYGKTLHAGDPVSIGDAHAVRGVVRVAAVAQTCITVDWTPPDAYDSCCEGTVVEFWGPEEQAKWAEAREADMPKIDPRLLADGPAPVELDIKFSPGAVIDTRELPPPDSAKVVNPPEAPKPKAPAMVTKRDAHTPPVAHGKGHK